MIFNSRFNRYPHQSFKIGNHPVKETDTYCYLGVEIHNTGSFAPARVELKKKAMRALYGLKSTVNKSKLSFRSLTTLFDSLIKPIVLYGAPIYTPNMAILKHITKDVPDQTNTHTNFHTSTLKKISLLNCEKVHLHFLKWALGVNRKASNAGVWGESGRYPLIYECVNLTLKYAQRLQNLKDSSLASLAFKEQKNMNLDWYRGIGPVLGLDPCYSADHFTAFRSLNNKNTKNDPVISSNHTTPAKPPKEDFLIHNGFKKRVPSQSTQPLSSNTYTPHIIMKILKSRLKESWKCCVDASRKLEFYREIKDTFIKESYLDQVKDYNDRVNVTRLRISAHRLEIELGQHSNTPGKNGYVLGVKLL